MYINLYHLQLQVQNHIIYTDVSYKQSKLGFWVSAFWMKGSFSMDLIDAGLCTKSAMALAVETLSVLKIFGESSKAEVHNITWTLGSAGVVAKIIQTIFFLKLQFWLTQNCLQIWNWICKVI